jgi:hypothetical protein
MHVENIKRTQEALARLMFTNHYRMDCWIESNECGTTLCLGGLACSLFHSLDWLNPSVDNLQRKNFRSSIKTLYGGSSLSFEDNVKQKALRFFGLVSSPRQLVDNIFYSNRWPCGLVALYAFTRSTALDNLDRYDSTSNDDPTDSRLYRFVSENYTLPRSFFSTLAGYLALQSLIDFGEEWVMATYWWCPADFVSRNPEAVNRFIAISQELLATK